MFEMKVCRLCLGHTAVQFSLLDENIAKMLEAVTFKKLDLATDLSTITCLQCLLKLKLCYNFQQSIKQSEEKLLLNNFKIKHQPEEDSVKIEDSTPIWNNNCPICNYEDKIGINQHFEDHFKQRYEHEKVIHNCNKCGAKFQYNSLYKLHIAKVCPSQEIQEAKEKKTRVMCLKNINDTNAKDKIFKLGVRSTEAINLLLRTKEEKNDYYCTICLKKFANKRTFQAHSHKTRICHFCNKQVSITSYNRHISDHNLGRQVCHLCGATLQSKSSFMTHLFYSHNNLRYKCEHCGKLFKKKTAKDLHVRKDHLGKPTHYCDTCGKGFYTGRFLEKHIKMKHLKLRPHICQFCNKGFSSAYALKTHRRQHTYENPYKCEICGDGFKQNVSLKAHRKSKHNIAEQKNCDCKVCGKAFASHIALYGHMRLH